MDLILLAVGLALLIKGADFLVSGSSRIAKKFNIPDIVIGLTIVSFGTSAPELIVNLIASINGNSEIVLGNILGSNIANILLILGISAIIYPLSAQRNTFAKEIPFSILASFAVLVMSVGIFDSGFVLSTLDRSDGIILLLFFCIFMYYIFSIAKSDNENNSETDPISKINIWNSYGYSLLGLIILVLGGKIIVDSAVNLASSFGLSESVIGLTIVAVGTSLPELATSAVAAYKKQSDIAIGNVVGSNIFNIFWILGLSVLIRPVPVEWNLVSDAFVTLVASLVLLSSLLIGKKRIVERWQGVFMILCYIIYLSYLVIYRT